MRIYFNSIGILTAYNVHLTDMLQKLGINMHIDSENNLLRIMLIKHKIYGYKPRLDFISVIHKILSDKKLRSIFNKFDIIHINSVSKYTIRIMRISAIPKIFVLHAAPFHENEYELLANYVDLFIAPSEFTLKCELPKIRNFTNKPVVVIHHGINTQLFNTTLSIEESRKKLGIPIRCKVILWNDRISPEKDLKTFLKAIPLIEKQIPNVYFYIKGRAVVKSYLKEIYYDIKKVQRKSNVKIHVGWVPYEKLPTLYRMSDVFVRTSLYENFGLGFIEAMACGTPVVAANSATAPEVIGNAGLLFTPGDPDDLADKVIRVLFDDELRNVLSHNSVKRIDEYFRLDIMAMKYIRAYKSLINKL